MNNKVDEEKIIQVQFLADYAINLIVSIGKNKQASEQVGEFLKSSNPVKLFELFDDLVLPLAATHIANRDRLMKNIKKHFPATKLHTKCLIENAEELLKKGK